MSEFRLLKKCKHILLSDQCPAVLRKANLMPVSTEESAKVYLQEVNGLTARQQAPARATSGAKVTTPRALLGERDGLH